MDRRASDTRRGTALAVLVSAWAVAVAVAYFWPTAADGVGAVVDGSLPDVAITGEPLRRLGSVSALRIREVGERPRNVDDR